MGLAAAGELQDLEGKVALVLVLSGEVMRNDYKDSAKTLKDHQSSALDVKEAPRIITDILSTDRQILVDIDSRLLFCCVPMQ